MHGTQPIAFNWNIASFCEELIKLEHHVRLTRSRMLININTSYHGCNYKYFGGVFAADCGKCFFAFFAISGWSASVRVFIASWVLCLVSP